MPPGQEVKVVTASLGATFRVLTGFGVGLFGEGYSVTLAPADGKYAVANFGSRKVLETSKTNTFKRPAQPLQIYEYEICPFCKKVREAVSNLDLDVVFYPCPRNGKTWRPKVVELGGKAQYPYLVDPNTGKAMYESDDIINYLYNEYGDGKVPLALRLGLFTTMSCGWALLLSGMRGGSAKPSKIPEQPLVFWGYEMSPFVKIVREVLCELELPYLQKTASRGSSKRQELLDAVGHFQVPYLEDPNAGVRLFESAAIIKYLQETYGRQ